MRLWHVLPSALAKHEGAPVAEGHPTLAMVLVCPWLWGFLGPDSFPLAAPWWRFFGFGRFSRADSPRLFRCDQSVPRPLPLRLGWLLRRLLGPESSPLATPCCWLFALSALLRQVPLGGLLTSLVPPVCLVGVRSFLLCVFPPWLGLCSALLVCLLPVPRT